MEAREVYILAYRYYRLMLTAEEMMFWQAAEELAGQMYIENPKAAMAANKSLNAKTGKYTLMVTRQQTG